MEPFAIKYAINAKTISKNTFILWEFYQCVRLVGNKTEAGACDIFYYPVLLKKKTMKFKDIIKINYLKYRR